MPFLKIKPWTIIQIIIPLIIISAIIIFYIPPKINAPQVLCSVLRTMPQFTECTVDPLRGFIDVRSEATPAVARTICAQIQSITVARPDSIFKHMPAPSGNGYVLRILSPFSGDHTLATCSLPR